MMTIDTPPASQTMPKQLALFRQLLAIIGKAELLLAIISLVVVVALSIAQAFLRYFGGGSLWWAQEVAETMILVTYFFGISYVFKTRQEIYIEFVAMLMPIRTQMIMFILEQLFTLGFALALLWLAWLFAPTMLNMQTPLLKLPGWTPFAPLIFSTIMIGLTSIYYGAFGLWTLANGLRAESIFNVEARGIILKSWPSQL